MTVHENSVINTQIQDYDEDLYAALTEQENYCYTESTYTEDGVTEYRLFFKELSDAICYYFTVAFDKELVGSALDSIYSFIILNTQFQEYNSVNESLDALSVFNLGTLRDTIINRETDYYDYLYTRIDSATFTPYRVAPKIQTDTTNIMTQAATVTTENLQALVDTLAEKNRSYIQRMMYVDVYTEVPDPAPANGYLLQVARPPAKSDMYSIIFEDYGWAAILDLFNMSDLNPANM
jgi:hypothetical protein